MLPFIASDKALCAFDSVGISIDAQLLANVAFVYAITTIRLRVACVACISVNIVARNGCSNTLNRRASRLPLRLAFVQGQTVNVARPSFPF